MAFQNPLFVQNENLPIHRGKGADGAKIDLPKPARVVDQDRKALRDLSKVGKPPVSAASKCARVKGKSPFSSLKTCKADQNNVTNDEEKRRFNEWAKEGIELAHYTGNDMLTKQKDMKEERIAKKVEKALTALREWNDMAFGIRVPLEEKPRDNEDVIVITLMPEVPPPMREWGLKSGIEDAADFLYDPVFDELLLFDYTTELKLKDEEDDSVNEDCNEDDFCV